MQGREIHFEHVRLVHDELAEAGSPLAQDGDQVAVDLDDFDAAAALEQRQRKRAAAGPDLDDPFARARIDRRGDAAEHGRDRAGNAGRSACARGSSERLGETDCLEEAARVRAAGAGQVECRAVVDGSSMKGQAERHVDRLAEARMLDHRKPLVVVHRKHRVRARQGGRRECRISGNRAGDGKATRTQRSDSRRNDFDFLAPEVPTFSGVRIEAADENARRCEVE